MTQLAEDRSRCPDETCSPPPAWSAVRGNETRNPRKPGTCPARTSARTPLVRRPPPRRRSASSETAAPQSCRDQGPAGSAAHSIRPVNVTDMSATQNSRSKASQGVRRPEIGSHGLEARGRTAGRGGPGARLRGRSRQLASDRPAGPAQRFARVVWWLAVDVVGQPGVRWAVPGAWRRLARRRTWAMSAGVVR